MIIAFDLEGTLVDGELLPAIGEEAGVRQKLEALTAQAMDGEVDFTSSLSQRIELIRGTSIHRVIEISMGLPLQRGALEAVDQIRLLGAHPIIVTGGFSVLAGQIARRLGIKYVACNRFMVENGVITGLRAPVIDEEMKRLKLKALASWLGVPIQRCVAVGDGANDIQMLKEAGLGIGFGDRECVKCADEVVNSGDLRDLVPLIRDHLHSTRTMNLSHPTAVTVL